MASWARRSPLLFFYILTFAISWSGMIPQALASHDLCKADGFLFSFLGVGGPALAVFIVHAVVSGKGWWRKSLQSVLRWRVGIQWYSAAFILPVSFYALAIALDLLLGGEPLDLHKLTPAIIGFVIFLQHFSTNVWEEIGWRGYALEMHQRRNNALTSTIIVAFLSGLWHLPLFFTAKYPMASVPYIIWLLEHSAAAMLLTWLYNSTRGSVLITTIFHAARNTVGVLIFLAAGGLPLRGFYLEFVAIAIAAMVVVWRSGASNLGLVNGESWTV